MPPNLAVAAPDGTEGPSGPRTSGASTGSDGIVVGVATGGTTGTGAPDSIDTSTVTVSGSSWVLGGPGTDHEAPWGARSMRCGSEEGDAP